MTKLHYPLLASALMGLAAAHMQMSYPPPLKSTFNPNTASGSADYSMTSPLHADGSDFPCKGYLSLLGTPQGKAVASWSAGQTYNFSVTGGAAHGGGSCQASLSLDAGKTFRVVHSYEGGCPGQGESSFQFAVPADTPAAEGAVFAWSWFNNLGNREMYMNCAVVDISGGAGSRGGEKVAFASRPGLFTANLGNGCRTVDSKDVAFPDPGPDLDSKGGAAPPTGSCGNSAAPGGGSGSSSGEGSGGSGGNGGSSGGGNSGETPPASTQVSPLPSPTPGPSPASTSSSSPGDSNLPSEPHSTQMPVADGSSEGWTPGNDWPDWFQSGAARACGRAYLLVSVWALLFAYFLF